MNRSLAAGWTKRAVAPNLTV